MKKEEEEEEEEEEEDQTPRYGGPLCALAEEEKEEEEEAPQLPPSKAEIRRPRKREPGPQVPTKELAHPEAPLKEVESLGLSAFAMTSTDASPDPMARGSA